LLERAVALRADAVLVHHGYFWRGENPVLTGMKYQRIRLLIENGINLFAYHLPLDAHAELGNNVQLARQLGIQVLGGLEPGNPRSLGLVGRLSETVSALDWQRRLEQVLARKPLLIAGGSHSIERIAWCTGGSQGLIQQAADAGVDAYLTGEVSEQTTHIARECGIHFIAAGHHATERYGVQAVGQWLARHCGIDHVFIDDDNPV
jgi:dinuclear metal center YbgI/SA1388 family protein